MARDQLSVGDLAAAVVAQDDEVRDQLKGLVTDMIKHMRYTMRHGDPGQKTALSKQIIPQLLTAINKVDADENEAEERAAYNRMMAAMRGEVAPIQPKPVEEPEATEDAAPPKKRAPRKKAAARKKAAT